MSGAGLVETFAARGIHVELDGTQIRFVALGVEFDAAAFAELRARKTELLRGLLIDMRDKRVGDLSPSTRWWPDAVREAFEERAAIVEYDANMDRETAELLAEIGVRNLLAEADHA